MTATNTPRLGLMAPVDSDLFLSSDFSTTFGKLDAVPGTTIVPNYASLPNSWGLPQHGSKVIQTDNMAEWLWYNPSGSGVWVRTNTVGLLASATQSAPVSTTIQSGGPQFISTGNFSAPGGRALRLHLIMGLDSSTGTDGICIITLRDNSTQLDDINFRPGPYVNSNGVRCEANFVIPASSFSPGSTHNVSASIRIAAIPAGLGGQGTSSCRRSNLYVSEI